MPQTCECRHSASHAIIGKRFDGLPLFDSALHLFQRLYELRDIPLTNFEDYLNIDIEIIMRQYIAYANDTFPVNIRVFL